ncbi:glycoside hydrolase family 10 protein [Planomonospora algeriensis]
MTHCVHAIRTTTACSRRPLRRHAGCRLHLRAPGRGRRTAAGRERPGAASELATATTAAAQCRTDARYPKRQLRGIWIATVNNIDWPVRTGQAVARQKADYVKLLDSAAKRRINAVFLQVRPASDALYRSGLEPWSKFLTGTAGKDPGWDPMPFLIDEAHKRGMEFHAWFNPYRAAYDTDVSGLPASHPARVHPDWVVKHEGRLYYNPGLPAVRDHVTAVIKDVVRRYDVDGVHFDDYFYPYPGRARSSRTAPPSPGTATARSWPTGGAPTSTSWSPRWTRPCTRPRGT